MTQPNARLADELRRGGIVLLAEAVASLRRDLRVMSGKPQLDTQWLQTLRERLPPSNSERPLQSDGPACAAGCGQPQHHRGGDCPLSSGPPDNVGQAEQATKQPRPICDTDDLARLIQAQREAYIEGMGVGYKAGQEPLWIPPECPYPIGHLAKLERERDEALSNLYAAEARVHDLESANERLVVDSNRWRQELALCEASGPVIASLKMRLTEAERIIAELRIGLASRAEQKEGES